MKKSILLAFFLFIVYSAIASAATQCPQQCNIKEAKIVYDDGLKLVVKNNGMGCKLDVFCTSYWGNTYLGKYTDFVDAPANTEKRIELSSLTYYPGFTIKCSARPYPEYATNAKDYLSTFQKKEITFNSYECIPIGKKISYSYPVISDVQFQNIVKTAGELLQQTGSYECRDTNPNDGLIIGNWYRIYDECKYKLDTGEIRNVKKGEQLCGTICDENLPGAVFGHVIEWKNVVAKCSDNKPGQDNVDDDGNGIIDDANEGPVDRCNYYTNYECKQVDEETNCDGIDNDFDGKIDEGYPQGQQTADGIFYCIKGVEIKVPPAPTEDVIKAKVAECEKTLGLPPSSYTGGPLGNTCDPLYACDGKSAGDVCYLWSCGCAKAGGPYPGPEWSYCMYYSCSNHYIGECQKDKYNSLGYLECGAPSISYTYNCISDVYLKNTYSSFTSTHSFIHYCQLGCEDNNGICLTVPQTPTSSVCHDFNMDGLKDSLVNYQCNTKFCRYQVASPDIRGVPYAHSSCAGKADFSISVNGDPKWVITNIVPKPYYGPQIIVDNVDINDIANFEIKLANTGKGEARADFRCELTTTYQGPASNLNKVYFNSVGDYSISAAAGAAETAADSFKFAISGQADLVCTPATNTPAVSLAPLIVRFKVNKMRRDTAQYTDKTVFLVSDEDVENGGWDKIMSLVPVAVWNPQKYSSAYVQDDANWCHKTDTNKCGYPLLVWHKEGNNFDADAIIRFVKNYGATDVISLGDLPTNFQKNLPVAAIKKIDATDILDFWKTKDKIDTVIFVENDYQLALQAAQLAAIYGVPLVVKDSTSYNQNKDLLEKINVICIGACPSDVNCVRHFATFYDVRNEIKSKITAPNKFILVNPNDIQTSYCEEQNLPDGLDTRFGNKIKKMFCKDSLIAPYLAVAREELIINTKIPPAPGSFYNPPSAIGYDCKSSQRDAIEQDIQNAALQVKQELDWDLVKSGINDVEGYQRYFTTLASPRSVPLRGYDASSKRPCTNEWDDHMIPLDSKYYYDFNLDKIEDGFVGRIYGFSPSDTSSYISRSVFFNQLADSSPGTKILDMGYAFASSRGGVINIKGLNTIYPAKADVECYTDLGIDYPININTIGVNPSSSVYSNHIGEAIVCKQGEASPVDFWKKDVVVYMDHGLPFYIESLPSKKLMSAPYLDVSNELFLTEACLTGDHYQQFYNPGSSGAAYNNKLGVLSISTLRNGVIGYYGSISVTSGTLCYVDGLPPYNFLKQMLNSPSLKLGELSRYQSINKNVAGRHQYLFFGDPLVSMEKKIDQMYLQTELAAEGYPSIPGCIPWGQIPQELFKSLFLDWYQSQGYTI